MPVWYSYAVVTYRWSHAAGCSVVENPAAPQWQGTRSACALSLQPADRGGL